MSSPLTYFSQVRLSHYFLRTWTEDEQDDTTIMLLPQGARADGCRIIEVYHCSLPNKREEFFFIFFDKHQLSCLYGQTINQNALINKVFVRRQKNIPLGLNHSLNRMIVLKEKKFPPFRSSMFKKQHLISAVLGRWLPTCLRAIWEYCTAAQLQVIKELNFKRRETAAA